MREIAKRRDALPDYAGYDVLAKWDSPSFDAVTRRVLADRLHDLPARKFFSEPELSLLEAIVDLLAPPLPGLAPAMLARWIDDRVGRNLGEGFRGAGAPPFQQNWRTGLIAIDAEARRLCGAPFVALALADQEKALRAVQAGETDATLWSGVDPATFFSDTLLKTVAGLAYAHPLAWSDIGFGGPASPRGYVRLGFDSRDPWEAKERR